MPPGHHVTIGDGATAAAFATHGDVGPGDRLTVLGAAAGQLGRGLAYGDHRAVKPWRYAYLLNSPSGAFGDGFVAYLRKRWDGLVDDMQHRHPGWVAFGADHIAAGDLGALFAPRAVFGDYLAQMAQEALAGLHEKGVAVSQRTAIANHLSRDGDRFRITLSTGEVIRADRVDVATGGPTPQRFGADAGPTAFTTLYGNEDAIAEVLVPGQVVTCLGGNAAMLDVLRFMQSVMDDQDIRLRVIRRGPGPEPLIWTRPRRAAVTPRVTGKFETAADLIAAIDREIAGFRKAGATMAELRPGYLGWARDTPLSTLLDSLTEQQAVRPLLEQRFRRGTHDALADYDRLHAAGQIEEVTGEINWVYAERPGHVRIRVKTGGGTTELSAPVVINTAGSGGQLALDLLTSGMVRDGWLALNHDKTGVTVGAGLETAMDGVRYLSPAVTEIGGVPLAFALHDVEALQRRVAMANAALTCPDDPGAI